jgi:hypothetical protein
MSTLCVTYVPTGFVGPGTPNTVLQNPVEYR